MKLFKFSAGNTSVTMTYGQIMLLTGPDVSLAVDRVVGKVIASGLLVGMAADMIQHTDISASPKSTPNFVYGEYCIHAALNLKDQIDNGTAEEVEA